MSLQALCRNLTNIIESNQQIYALALRKKEILIAGNIDSLAKIVQQESDLIKTMGLLEAGRQQLVNDVIQEYKVNQTETILLTDLLAHIPDSAEKEELNQLYTRLNTLLSDVQSMNELNQQLIENSLEFVNYSIELFTEVPDEQIYHKPAVQDSGSIGSQRRSIFDTKA